MKGTGSAITESSKEQIDEAYSTPEETRLAAIKGGSILTHAWMSREVIPEDVLRSRIRYVLESPSLFKA